MKAEEIKNLYATISALPTAGEQMAAFQKAFEGLNDDHEKSLAAYQELQNESTTEITRLSQELEFYNSPKSKGQLSVTVGDKRYTTPAGRKYQLNGETVAAEDLVKNQELSERLIRAGSPIFASAQ